MAIHGECFGAGVRATVTVTELDRSGCKIETDFADVLADLDLMLWIGAIGPIAFTAKHMEGRRLVAQFKEPLDDRILQHFDFA